MKSAIWIKHECCLWFWVFRLSIWLLPIPSYWLCKRALLLYALTFTHGIWNPHAHTHTYMYVLTLVCPSLSSPFHTKVVLALGDYLDAQCHACIGGTNVRADIAKLEMGQQIVVGTPGRVMDMIQRRALGELSSSLSLFLSLSLSSLSLSPFPPSYHLLSHSLTYLPTLSSLP